MTITSDKKEYKVIGTRPVRHDGLDKVTGRAIYGADIKLPRLIWGAVLRSPHSHAKVVSVDTSAAEQLPGVCAVMTAADMPAPESRLVDLGEGEVNFKWAANNIMASVGDKVLYKGHPVAAVAAIDRYAAMEALKSIIVKYEVLTPVTNVKEAMSPGAPILIPELKGDDLGQTVTNTNVATHLRRDLGDIDNGFQLCTHTIEREYSLRTVHQGYIEPHTATALWDEEGRIKVWTSTQGAFTARSQIAGLLEIGESRVRVYPLEIGGGFGGKINVYLEPLAAILSRKSGGRPVKLVMERTEVFEASGPAPGGVVKVKIGTDGGGRLIAATADIKLEGGAYPGSSIPAASICIFAPYDIPNMRVDAYDVVVNKPKSAAYRAPGSPQVAFAMESLVDELCSQQGWNPLEFRMKNASEEGTRRADGVKYSRIGNKEVLEALKNSDHWNSPKVPTLPGRKIGRGIASGFWFNIGLQSAVTLTTNPDGVVFLVEGSTDIGGTRVSIAMQAAEVLGIPVDDIRPSVVDTESVGYTDVTGGSRTTYATGYAAYEAANKLIEELKKRAAQLWQRSEADISFKDGVFYGPIGSSEEISFKELCAKQDSLGGRVSVSGTSFLKSGGNGFAAHIVDLEVDPETGKTDVTRYTAIQDAGKAIHPSYVEGQMQGGAAQGIGWALNEEYYLKPDGSMANASFLDYRMPTSYDLPNIETIIVEVPNPLHPFGVRGVGEPPICPPVPAVANAIADAVGVRMYDTPMNPARIYAALSAKSAEE